MKLEKNIIYCSEALKKLAELPTNSFDFCLTDLPYGETAQSWDKLIEIAPMWRELKRVMKRDTAIILFAPNLYGAQLIVSQPKAYKFKYYWKKNRAPNCHQAKVQPLRNCEELLVFSFGKLPYFPQKSIGHPPTSASTRKKGTTSVYRQAETFHYVGGDTTRFPRTVLEFDCLDNNAPERFHPNQKPVAMLQHLIRQHCPPGGLCLDFCSGSGSFGIASILEKRDFILIDQDKDCVSYATQWINKITGNHEGVNFVISNGVMPLFERQI